MAAPLISIVVPTYRRPEGLSRCLRALDSQTAEWGEVIVVDDGGRQDGAVERVVASSPRSRLLRSSGRGPAAARNAGAASATGEKVLFTDDDCVPDSGWVAALATALDHSAAAAGVTLEGPPGGPLAGATQHVADYLTAATRNSQGRVGFAATSNLGCRAELVRTLPFDEGFPAPGGEDRDWCARLRGAGHDLAFVPGAAVSHHQELTVPAFWRKHMGYGRGAWKFRRRHGSPDTGAVRCFHVRMIAGAFHRGFAEGAAVCIAQIATAVGFAREALADLRRGER